MGNPKQPIDLLLVKGKKHLTKAEIEDRRQTEIKAPADGVSPPSYLTTGQKREFRRIAKELLALEIISNLDCDALARYIQSADRYVEYDRMVTEILAYNTDMKRMMENIGLLREYENLRDKYFKQCRAAASDFGLTITSRCRLTVPKKEEKKENKYAKFG